MKKINYKILLSIWSYIGWFGCVFFEKNNWGLATVVFPLVAFYFLNQMIHITRSVLSQLLIIFFIGSAFDYLALVFHVIRLSETSSNFILPIWLISLWLLFVSTLPVMKNLFKENYFLISLFGGVFGPLSYYAGSRFNVLFFENRYSMMIYAFFWAIYFVMALYWLKFKTKMS